VNSTYLGMEESFAVKTVFTIKLLDQREIHARSC